MKLKYWFDCRIKRKHRYSFYTDKCIVCGKRKPASSGRKSSYHDINK